MSLQTLIIDDDPLMSFIHRKLLAKSKIADAPLVFCNGQEALDYLFKDYKTENQYLILLDIHMPVLNGWGFLQEIKDEFKQGNLHVYIVSSSIQIAEQDTAKGFNHVVDYIEKPLKPENLEKIKSLISSLPIV